MTKDQFIEDYCKRSRVGWRFLSDYLIALPCACGEEGCNGFVMVSKDEEAVKCHNELYAPATRKID